MSAWEARQGGMPAFLAQPNREGTYSCDTDAGQVGRTRPLSCVSFTPAFCKSKIP